MSVGAAATMALPMKAEMMVDASIFMVDVKLKELLLRKMLV
jgi:hypothetical protein